MRQLLHRIIGGGEVADPKRGRLLIEPLEKRQLLAGDLELLFTDGSETQTTSAPAETGIIRAAGQAEGELAPDLVQFATDLADAGVQFFGAHWCPACTQQKELFDDGKDNLPFIEVTNSQRQLNDIGIAEGITEFPTWEFPDGSREIGVLSLDTLSQRSNVPIPQSEQPTFEPIGNRTVRIGSPRHVPIDVYDPDGGPQSVTVSIDNPALLEATVLSGNRSIRIDMATYGDMVFELFEQRAPVASGRVIALANQEPVGFYDGIIFHRVVDNFVIQGGDPTGTGTGGSSLGTFDDDFHPDLQHNREGVLSYAKSSDDTNDSQFFITEVPTRFLDFNHSVFGQLVEGFDVREAISGTSTPQSRGVGSSQKPDIDVTIETIEVFNDLENSVVMLKALGIGSTNVTFTVTDTDGNSHSETVLITTAADTANSQPFLNAIATPAPTPANTPAQLQLSSVDVENDAVTYFATSQSNPANGTVSVNSSTGLVTVTPASGFTGTINVQVGVEPGPGVVGNASGDSDTQTVPFLFEGESVSAPTSVDLQASSDSGTSNSDNITNAGSLTFAVNGVASGSTVELINVASGSVVGTGLATGTSIAITTSNIAALGDGTYQIAARQRSGSNTSGLSPALTIQYDSTAPDSVVASANTRGNVGRAYLSDLISPEEGSGLIYALSAAPNGATINSNTGVVNWTPQSSQLGDNTFSLELTDAAGNTRSESFTVAVAGAPLAEIKLQLTDLQGNPITAIAAGQSFLLNFIAADARFGPKPGVFAAYTDILFDSGLVRPVPGSPIEYNDDFPIVRKGTFSTGLIDEIGAVSDSIVATNVTESLIATIRMEALSSGTVNIRSEPADESNSEILLYLNDNQIPAESVAFGSATLAIGQSFTVGDDVFTVAEDSGATALDVLANDEIVSGSGSLSVVSVTQPASGGSVTLDGGVVRFTPATNFNGQTTFTYRVSDSGGVQENGSVTMTVSPVNDAPDGVDDSLNVNQNSTNNTLNVLANDIDVDGNSLTIQNVGTTNNGGSVTINSGGKTLNYSPLSGFTGTETFTYTVTDGSLTDVVNVTVTVAPADNPPTANNDSFDLTEDDPEAEFDVLSNDTRDVDNQTFVIDSVGVPTQGGSARVSADGTQFFYAPAANFADVEEVSYTIRDTGGGLSVATATFTVAGVNDPPPIADLTVVLNRGAGESLVFSLTDLPANVDLNETLAINTAASPTTAGGSIRIDGTTILYTAPSADFTGDDSFAYSIGDGSALSSSGTINVEVSDFTERNIRVNFGAVSVSGQVNGIMLRGTNLLGENVQLPLAYQADTALFAGILPGDYTIDVPAIPFFQKATSPRQISVTSAAEDGDMTVDVEIGALRPEFISIRDWLGSTSDNSILTAVEPGQTDLITLKSTAADTISNPVVELDTTGDNVTIHGTAPDSTDPVVPQTIPTRTDARVQSRGVVDGIQLLKISGVTFTTDATSGPEGEAFVPASSSNVDQPPAVQATQASSSVLSLGGLQAEGESIAAGATTQTDLFVPVSNLVSTRTDATVLPLEHGDVWLGESTSEDSSGTGFGARGVDEAMRNVASDLTLVSATADSLATESETASLDESAIDAVLQGEL